MTTPPHRRITSFIKTLLSSLYLRFKNLNRILVTGFFITITVVVLGLLIYRQWDVIINYHWQFRPLPFLLSFLLFSIALFWVALIWGWIINNIGEKLSFRKHIRYYIISNLAKRIPGTIWYIASRAQFYLSEGFEVKTTAIASAIEMVMITLAGILVVLAFSYQTLIQYHISPFVFVVIFFAGLLVLHPRVIQWMLRQRKLESNELKYRFVLQGILAYCISWVLGGIILFEIGNVIYPITSDHIHYFITCWTLVGIISTILFFSPSNFGITEIGLSLLLSNVVPSSIAVLIAVSSRIVLIVYELIWASLFFVLNPTQKSPVTRKD